jgi:hypothetical protein
MSEVTPSAIARQTSSPEINNSFVLRFIVVTRASENYRLTCQYDGEEGDAYARGGKEEILELSCARARTAAIRVISNQRVKAAISREVGG